MVFTRLPIAKFNKIFVFNTYIVRSTCINVIFLLWNFSLWDFYEVYFFIICISMSSNLRFTSKHLLHTSWNIFWCNSMKILLRNFMYASKNIRRLSFFLTNVLKRVHISLINFSWTINARTKYHEKIIMSAFHEIFWM